MCFQVADDTQGRGILKELEADGVDTSFFVVTFVCVDTYRLSTIIRLYASAQ